MIRQILQIRKQKEFDYAMTQSMEEMIKTMEEMIKKIILLISLIFILSIPTTSFGMGLEIAGGAWYQRPSGNMSFDNTTQEDDLDLEDDLNYDDKWKAFGRLILDTPLFLPNIYLMYTPMKWDEAGVDGHDKVSQ